MICERNAPEAGATISISGGTISGGISRFGGPEINIFGGTFLGGPGFAQTLLFSNDSASINISGGIFSQDVSFSYDSDPNNPGSFKFFGDLAKSAPSLISSSTSLYETHVSGTLVDGNYFSRRIVCTENLVSGGERKLCGGVQIHNVPAPAVIWLFGIGLIGLIGFSNRRKAA